MTAPTLTPVVVEVTYYPTGAVDVVTSHEGTVRCRFRFGPDHRADADMAVGSFKSREGHDVKETTDVLL